MGVLDIRPWEAEAQVLWETTEISGAKIAAQFGVSKNTIVGLARRRKWLDRVYVNLADGETPRNLHDRLDAIWAKFEAAMVECERLQEISRTHWKAHDRHQRDQAAD